MYKNYGKKMDSKKVTNPPKPKNKKLMVNKSLANKDAIERIKKALGTKIKKTGKKK